MIIKRSVLVEVLIMSIRGIIKECDRDIFKMYYGRELENSYEVMVGYLEAYDLLLKKYDSYCSVHLHDLGIMSLMREIVESFNGSWDGGCKLEDIVVGVLRDRLMYVNIPLGRPVWDGVHVDENVCGHVDWDGEIEVVGGRLFFR